MRKYNKIRQKLVSILVLVASVIYVFSGPYLRVLADAPRAATVNGIYVNVRTSPVNGSVICKVNTGHELTVLSEANGSDGKIWYNVNLMHNGEEKNGWIQSTYVEISTAETNEVVDAQFEAYLDNQGFPESYKKYIRTLHASHPNWVFNALQTGIDWEAAMAGELEITSRNLIPASSISSWKSIADGAYNWETGEWYEIEPGWVPASEELIRYYMDPRNFLVDDNRILMFMSLNWTGTETLEGVSNILQGTAMGSSSENFAQYFYEAGRANDISAYHLAVRAVQETGGGVSGSVSGTYKNYYNIGATGSNPVAAAVQYAKEKGWDTAQKSISEGATFVADSYVKKAQNSLYLQKFDVVDGGNGFYWHQYMGALQAPESEAKKLAKAYSNLSTASIVFTIPVFNNMPETPASQPSTDGNPNNLLNSIWVDGYALTPSFNKFKYSYDVIVPEELTSVNITASPVLNTSVVNGTGAIDISQSAVTKVVITVTPENYGTPRKYTVNIAKGSAALAPTYVKGDTNNDGRINVVDLVMIKKHIVNLSSLEGNGFSSGDINGDGYINIVDLVMVKKHIVGLQQIQ